LTYDTKRPKGSTTLKGLRLGVLTSYINHTVDETSKEVSSLFEKSVSELNSAGIHLIPLDTPEFDPLNLATADVALYEFHQSLNKYLSQPTHSTCPTLAQILTSPLIDPLAVGPTWQMAFNLSTSDPAYHTRLTKINHLKLLLAKMFAENELNGLIYPHQTVLVAKVGATYQPGRNGLLTSLTGTPGVVIPVGMSSSCGTAEQGVPAGMEVVGLWGGDWRGLGIAMEVARFLDGRHESLLL
jgi:Asp-tRNA(Asn)/Glu-tRNA(Gln) amidotransferase A subunit family amidase